jgi:hypothetical protein
MRHHNDRIQSRDTPSEICGGQSGTGDRFLFEFFGFAYQSPFLHCLSPPLSSGPDQFFHLIVVHSPPSSMSGVIPPLPQYAFMAWCSVKAQGQLYLYIYLYLSQCLTKQHAVKTYWGSGGIAPRILLTSTLDGGEWSALRPGRFTPR